MKVSNDDKVLIGAGGLGVILLAYLYWKKKQAGETLDLPTYTPEVVETAATPKTANTPAQGATLDRNKLLKVGSKGLEVRELQRLLGIEIDGDFGTKETLPALQKAKGVSEISLNAFSQKKKVKVSLPKKGQKPTAAKDNTKITNSKLPLPKVGQNLMASVDKIKLYRAKRTASGSYFNSGEIYNGDFEYGNAIGTFVALNGNGYSQYLIKRNDLYFFVNADSVKTY